MQTVISVYQPARKLTGEPVAFDAGRDAATRICTAEEKDPEQ